MASYISLATIFPVIYTLVATILINLGGVNLNTDDTRASYTHFALLDVKYYITPWELYDSYSYKFYLNRICLDLPRNESTQAGQEGTRASTTCIDTSIYNSLDSKTLPLPNRLMYSLDPFRFDSLILKIPFTFYLLSAILAFPVLILGLLSAKTRGRGVKLSGMIISTVILASQTIASSVLTYQVFHLRDQVMNDTIRSRTIKDLDYVTMASSSTTYTVHLQEAFVGVTVLGLTWGSVAAMLGASALWQRSWRSSKNTTAGYAEKNSEKLSYESTEHG